MIGINNNKKGSDESSFTADNFTIQKNQFTDKSAVVNYLFNLSYSNQYSKFFHIQASDEDEYSQILEKFLFVNSQGEYFEVLFINDFTFGTSSSIDKFIQITPNKKIKDTTHLNVNLYCYTDVTNNQEWYVRFNIEEAGVILPKNHLWRCYRMTANADCICSLSYSLPTETPSISLSKRYTIENESLLPDNYTTIVNQSTGRLNSTNWLFKLNSPTAVGKLRLFSVDEDSDNMILEKIQFIDTYGSWFDMYIKSDYTYTLGKSLSNYIKNPKRSSTGYIPENTFNLNVEIKIWNQGGSGSNIFWEYSFSIDTANESSNKVWYCYRLTRYANTLSALNMETPTDNPTETIQDQITITSDAPD